MNCPNCGHAITTAKARKPRLVESSDVSQMSDAELFAYRKRTAPLEDLRFWLNNARMSDQLRAGFLALQASAQVLTIPRAEFYRQFVALQALWRRESNARERLETHRIVPVVYGEIEESEHVA